MKVREVLGITMLVSTLFAVPGMTQALDPERVHWSAVTMEATKFGFSTSSDISFSLIPTEEGVKSFVKADSKGNYPEPEGPKMVLMKVLNSFMGRNSDTRFWLEPSTARVFQRQVLETGKRNRYKACRFTGDGAWEYRKDPTEDEENKPPASWTQIRTELDSYSGWPANKPVTDSAGLFYIVAASTLQKKGDHMVAHVVSKEKVFAIDIRVKGLEQLKTDFTLRRSGTTTSIKGKVPALHLTLTPIPPAGAEVKDFKLIGLKGAVNIWIDPTHRFPLQIEGKVKIAGRVKIRLQGVEITG